MSDCVYILYSKKLDRYYTGYTGDLNQRLEFHRHPSKSTTFTSKADDWLLYYVINCESEQQARSIESHIKRMKSRRYIENLKIYVEITRKLLTQYRDC
jgi:putative endonuclease